MKKAFSLAAALAVCAGVAHAQTVEFRIIERKGRTVVTGAPDAQLDLAVQARVIGPPLVGASDVSFNIHIVGELEAWGTLERAYISNPDHTTSQAIAVSNSIGLGGLASQYSYLASINASFNGLINTSSSTFTNTPDQEISIVTGHSAGTAILATPGIDLNGDGNPDGWGRPDSPGATTNFPLPAGIAQDYFGAGANWVDVYRFRYTVTNFATRALDIRIEGSLAQVSAGLEWNQGLWSLGPNFTTPTQTSNLRIGVGQTVAGSCCDGAGGCAVVLPSACTGQFIGSSTCNTNACSTPVVTMSGCCDPFTRTCTVAPWNACNGLVIATGSCVSMYSYCPGSATPPATLACCDASGGCTLVTTSTGCPNLLYGPTTCSPNPCPAPMASGACCRSGTNQCVLTLAGACAGSYHGGAACFPSPCTATPGTCCNLSTGACAYITHASCTGQNYWLALGVCAPNPCPPPLVAGACCVEGTCALTAPAACTGTFSGASTCGVSTCQVSAACCDWTTGNCVVILSTACVGPLPIRATCTPTPCPPPPITVQARIVERHNRTLVTGPADAQLDLAVQARVVAAGPSVGLSGLAFNLHIAGESESSGTLARAVTSNPDHTYSSTFALSNVLGIGGLASQYTFAAASNPNNNGLINTSGGTFTNGPDQEIGLINARTSGGPFLSTPGIDNDMDTNPDSWPGSGSGLAPPNNTRAVLTPAAAPIYFGSAGHWVDVYRFRYTVSTFASRPLVFRLEGPQATVFSQVQFAASTGLWSPWTSSAGVNESDLVIGVVNAALGTCCDAGGNCTLLTRANCTGMFTGASSCDSGICVTPVLTGACCTGSGECSLVEATACEGNFIGAAACDPSPCPPPGLAAMCCIGACCQNRACSISTASGCPTTGGYSFKGPGTTCGPDPDPAPCCPANFNQYGGVNVQDIYDFIAAWFAADPAADFDGSGVLTTVDVLEFIRVWIGGC